MDSKKIAVIGAGPVGGILACRLAKAGHVVYIVDIIKDIVDAINENGINVTGALECSARVTGAFASIEDIYEIEPDYVFLTVKSVVLPRILEQLKPFDREGTAVISFQNGIDTEEIIASAVSPERVMRGVVNYAGGNIGPGRIKATFFNPPNYFGAVAAEGAGAAKDVATIVSAAGLESEYSEAYEKTVWRKAILNSCLMPTSVVTRLTMDKIMELEGTRRIVEEQIREFLVVAAAE